MCGLLGDILPRIGRSTLDTPGEIPGSASGGRSDDVAGPLRAYEVAQQWYRLWLCLQRRYSFWPLVFKARHCQNHHNAKSSYF